MELKHLQNCTCVPCEKKRRMVHIHVHSDHSSLDGVNKIPNLVQRAKDYGHSALVLNDHGNPSGIFQFYKECKKQGIKPILGLEFYITNDLREKIPFGKRDTVEDNDYHQSIFIKDNDGYLNYNYLTYVSFTDGYYYKPRIDFDLLFEKKQGLMATSSCIASKVNQYLTLGKNREAEQLFKKFRDEFGDDFYAEIQLNELNDKSKFGISQMENNSFIIKMANKFDVPILIGGDIHYLDPEDNELQDALLSSKTKVKEGEEAFKIHARHLFYSGYDDIHEFNKKFGFNYDEKFIDQCLENSMSFAEKPNFEFKTGKYNMPKISIGVDTNSDEYLEKLAYIKLAEKIKIEKKYYQGKWNASYLEKVKLRIAEELRVIKILELADYLLIVYDIINFEKENGILVGAGRGCFLPNQYVEMADGTKTKIQEVEIGSQIKNHFEGVAEVTDTLVYEIDEEIIELVFTNGKVISCTTDHEFFTENRGWVKAKDISEKDLIKSIYGSETIKLETSKLYNYKGEVYDLSVNTEDKSYNINGAVVHNSAAGSMVAFLLSITALDPIEHGLLFERFINEHRKVMCLTESNYIKLEEGNKRILDVNTDDSLCTFNSNELVLINENDYDGEVIILEENGISIEVTPNHVIPVIRDGIEINILAKDVITSDSLIVKSK